MAGSVSPSVGLPPLSLIVNGAEVSFAWTQNAK